MATTFLASDGDGYELQMGRWSRRLAPLFVEFSGAGGSGGRVLDVGCGTGSLSLALAANSAFSAVRGIDVSADYVDYVKRRASNHAHASFEVADACALPFEDAAFDHALSLLVLQFIPQGDRVVGEMRRVTRPGGIVAAATWDTVTMPIHRIVFEAAAQVDPRARQIRNDGCARPMANADGLLASWQRSGLAHVVPDKLTVSMDFASFADFWAPVEGSDGPYAQYFHSLDDGLKASVRESVRAAYLDGAPDGPRSWPSHAWVVKGVVP